MAKMGFKNFREPVVYILNQELRKRNFKNKIRTDGEKYESLPEYPVDIVRNNVTQKVEKIIYAQGTSMEWSEELFRDFANKVTRIKVTYPDKLTSYIDLVRDVYNKVTRVEENK